VLAEAYNEVQGTNFAELGAQTFLMAAMQKQLRGVDYPNDQMLILNQNEAVKYKYVSEYYKKMYLDGFGTMQQLSKIRFI